MIRTRAARTQRRQAVDACRYFAALIVGALHGYPKQNLLDARFALEVVDWTPAPLAPAIARISAGSFKEKTAGDIRAMGYVAHTLEAALWAFHRTDTFATARSCVQARR